MPSEKSEPITSPDGPTRRASSIARSPVPVATSSTRSPGPTAARSAARERQRWCIPTVMTEFMRSYTPAMRSNIARTCVSGSVPLRAVPTPPREASVIRRLPQGAEEVHQLVEPLWALLLKTHERGHWRGGVDQRARDCLPRQPRADVRQVRAWARVAVLADLVAAEAARG